MITVNVQASRCYNILIGGDILQTVGSHVKALGGVQRVFLVSDTNVFPIYGKTVIESLENVGLSVDYLVIPSGEEQKNGAQFLAVLDAVSQAKLTRSDLLIALGGGVVGDLTGFCAACYLRGIRYVQIPTTLLAMVDSSVGGKTAIDLPAGKNLCGAFWQPSLVLCDTAALDSLPVDIFRDGCAEVIKYGILYDRQLFSQLERDGLSFDREQVIARCVSLKRDVVGKDEFDTGERMKLNLGHTIGHGVEARSNFTLSHGKSVAIGIAIVSRACGCPDQARIVQCLQRFGLPVSTHYTPEEICSYALSDKKRSGDTVKLILPRAIGECAIVPTPVSQLLSFIKEGM